MIHRILATAVGLLIAAPLSGHAEMARHDIAWYEANPSARAAILRICRNDYSYAKRPDCQNAEQADIGTHHKSPGIMTPEQMLNSPSYWAENRWARLGALEECRTGVPGLMTPSMCAAARAGQALDPVNPRAR